jgi:hypothetical protein
MTSLVKINQTVHRVHIEDNSGARTVVTGVGHMVFNGGGSGSGATEFEYEAVANGAVVLTLPVEPIAPGDLYINGLKQRRTAYAVTSTTLTLPSDLNVITGDIITYIFQ